MLDELDPIRTHPEDCARHDLLYANSFGVEWIYGKTIQRLVNPDCIFDDRNNPNPEPPLRSTWRACLIALNSKVVVRCWKRVK